MSIESRLDRIEQLLGVDGNRPFSLTADGNMYTKGNVSLADDGRDPSNPLKWFMGKLGQGLYVFWQKRFAGQAKGEFWAGLETWLLPPSGRPVAEGYGALPLRIWGQGLLMEANGVLTTRHLAVDTVYLQTPKYMNRQTGQFEHARGWSDAGEPLTFEGEVMGGIHWDDSAKGLSTYLGETGITYKGRSMAWGDLLALLEPGR